MNSFDIAGYHLINQFAGHHPIIDAIMSFFAQFALEIYAVLFVLAWFLLPKSDVKSRHALVVSGFAGILALVINFVIAHIWYRPRPFVTLPHGSFNQIIPHSVDASFPSDHTSGSFGFASALWGKRMKWISYSFTTLAVIVMVARVYCGVHYPTDVLAGVVVGTISSRVMWKYFSRYLYSITIVAVRIFRFGDSQKGI